jgi:hypothetical protein
MRLGLGVASLLFVSTLAHATEKHTYALFRLDALGVEADIVDQLERILRVEIERVSGQHIPSRAEVEKASASNRKLAACTADPSCLAPLASLLHATRVISGNVGGLGDSYVVNLKLVDAADAKELRRVSATLRGSPEELIDEVRVAAYRLVAPEKLVGNVAVLSDVPGASVSLDGQPVGTTPLPGALAALSVGVHHLSVSREGFSTFDEDVPVRFEKTTQVVVRQSAMTKKARRALAAQGQLPIYTRWWFWGAMAVSAVATGLLIGYTVPKQTQVNCSAMGAQCP